MEPNNDRSLESWTDCPAFQEHIANFRSSAEFEKVASEAQPFFKSIQDYVFGRPTTLENIWNVRSVRSGNVQIIKPFADI